MKYKAISNYIEEFALWPGGQAWVYILVLSLFLLLALFLAAAGRDEEPTDLPAKQLPHGKGRWSEMLSGIPPWARGRTAFLLIIFLITLFGRTPGLLLEQINMDESSYLSGSITMAQGGLYWEDIDNLSSGPMIVVLGWMPKVLGLNIDYSSFRFMGILLHAGSWFLVYLTLALFISDRLARLTSLAGVVYSGLMSSPAFLALNSEVPPLFVTMIAAYYLARLPRAEPGKPLLRTVILLGLALGILPYTKIQSVPVGLLFAVWGGLTLLWMHRGPRWMPDLRKAWQPLGAYVLAGLLPTLLLLIYLVTLADFSMFWRSYIIDNLVYRDIPVMADVQFDELEQGQTGAFTAADYQFPNFLYHMPRLIMGFDQLSHLVVGCLIVLGLAAALFYARPVKVPGYWKYGVALALFFLACTVLIIILPGRPYDHYFEYLPTPLVILTGLAIAHALKVVQELPRLPRWTPRLAAGVAVAILTVPGALQSLRTAPQRVVVTNPAHYDDPPPYLDFVLRPFYEPGDRAVSFIYNPAFHVYSGLKLAEPRPVFNRLILHGTDTTYFQERFYTMMHQNPPEFFIDTTGQMWRHPARQDRLGELHAILQRDYVHFLDLPELNFFVHRDRFEKYPAMAEARELLSQQAQLEAYERALGPDGVRSQLDPRITVPEQPGQRKQPAAGRQPHPGEPLERSSEQ